MPSKTACLMNTPRTLHVLRPAVTSSIAVAPVFLFCIDEVLKGLDGRPELRSGRHGLVLGPPTFPWRLSFPPESGVIVARLVSVSSLIRRPWFFLLLAERAE